MNVVICQLTVWLAILIQQLLARRLLHTSVYTSKFVLSKFFGIFWVFCLFPRFEGNSSVFLVKFYWKKSFYEGDR